MSEASNAFHTEVQRLEGFIDSVRNLAAGNKANIDEIANLKGQIAGLQTELAAEQATNADLVAKLKAHNDMLSAVVAPAQAAA